MSTLDAADHFVSTTSWRARVRFVADLAPRGMAQLMAPDRAAALRLTDTIYRRTPIVLASVVVGWAFAVLTLWPAVHIVGLVLWTALLGAAWVGTAVNWWKADRPMLRPGAAPFWDMQHTADLWMLFLALASGMVLIYPAASSAHIEALCLTICGIGIASAIFTSSSLRGLAAVLGPSTGLVAVVLIFRGELELAAAVSLAGGITVLLALGLFQIGAEAARRDVETA